MSKYLPQGYSGQRCLNICHKAIVDKNVQNFARRQQIMLKQKRWKNIFGCFYVIILSI